MTDIVTATSKLSELLEDDSHLQIPGLGDLIAGTIISTKGREIRLDINGLTTGVVRGRELFSESGQFGKLQPGDKIEATVIDLENENGEMELSFRYAGNKKAWEDLRETIKAGDSVEAKVLDANKGGLIVKVRHLQGFLPVSQLAPEHYPRVSGGDKQKILDKLKEFVGEKFKVLILDLNETDEKLIVSEKAIWESEQKNVISQIKVGQIIKGDVTALADFGAFVKFMPEGSTDGTELEGLVHISEIAWQRIDHPKDILKVHQTVEAEIIGIEGSKIFLSMKKLVDDPWKDVEKKYKVGDVVEGKVLKANPFGLFVELDADIHGLAHVSELSAKTLVDPTTIAKSGDMMSFKIVSIEPKEHRLGLSLKALNEKVKTETDKDTSEEVALELGDTPPIIEEQTETEVEVEAETVSEETEA